MGRPALFAAMALGVALSITGCAVGRNYRKPLTAVAAVLAFIPLTSNVFWGSMAVTLIGGTIGGTVLTLLFLPALYAIWFRIRTAEDAFPAAQAQAAT